MRISTITAIFGFLITVGGAQASGEAFVLLKSDLSRESTSWWVQSNVRKVQNLADGYEYVRTSGDQEFSKFQSEMQIIKVVNADIGGPDILSGYLVKFVPRKASIVLLDLGKSTPIAYRATQFLIPIVDGEESSAINLGLEVEYPKSLYRALHRDDVRTSSGRDFPIVEFIP